MMGLSELLFESADVVGGGHSSAWWYADAELTSSRLSEPSAVLMAAT